MKEQTEFDVLVTSFDAGKKLMVIKEVKNILGIGLKESKDLVEKGSFTVKEKVNKEESEKLKGVLEKIGCVVELK